MEASTTLSREVLAALRSVVGEKKSPLHEPLFLGNEWVYVRECLDSGFVSSIGKFVDRFEADLASYTGSRYAIAVVNGTAALHVALLLAGVEQGDEVLVPALTFVATANAVTYCGASPHFVDSEVGTIGIDVARLRDYLAKLGEIRDGACINKQTGRIIRALVPMHTFGHPGDIDGLLAVAKDFKLALVEDAAESLGSMYHGRHAGTFGETGILSFNGNKIITTGGGGAILTNDQDLAKKAKHITTTAKLPHPWSYIHDQIANNYRMPNLNAALGCAQLEQIEGFLENKRKLYFAYAKAFSDVKGVQLVSEPEGARSNYWLQALLLEPEFLPARDLILSTTNAVEISTRPAWTPMHDLSHFQSCPKMDLSIANNLSQRLINIPSSAGLVGNIYE
ncbi:LegC family aminotransferase [Burkholderiales bacterium]|jgi:perosamine synthetase|nr:LegC family aminotransferase [Burkholderiales bacterium]